MISTFVLVGTCYLQYDVFERVCLCFPVSVYGIASDLLSPIFCHYQEHSSLCFYFHKTDYQSEFAKSKNERIVTLVNVKILTSQMIL